MNQKKQIIKCTRRRAAVAIVAAVAMLIFTGLAAAGEGANGRCLAAAIILAAAGGLFVLLDFSYGRVISLCMYLLLPAASFAALENYTHVLTDFELPIVILNLAFFYLLYGFFAFLAGSVKWGFTAAALVPFLFGLANYFVVSFRSSPIVPWDFLSVGTAMSVADNYSFTMTWKAAFVSIGFVWILLIASKSSVRIPRKPVRFSLAFVYGLLLAGYISGIQLSSVQSFFGMDTTLFTLNVLYRNNGIAAAFLGNLQFLNIQKPSGYSVSAVEELVAEVAASSGGEGRGTEAAAASSYGTEDIDEEGLADSSDGEVIIDEENPAASFDEVIIDEENPVRGTEDTVQKNMEYPNIVVIMNEAFSDLSVWGEFETTEEVMPFFKGLQEEAVGGELYVSVKGGNTANTEFEFLTGDTMGFLPTGSVPYQQYINAETPSLASYLKSLGYSTTAIHPYNASGWDRDTVYEDFGFDEFLSRTDFVNPYTMRGYISDRSAFEKIIEQFEKKETGTSSFIFEVTMQNHGAYSKESPDFETYINFAGTAGQTTSEKATEKYLTLMHETDLALEELVSYFESLDEPVVLVMFGDHQPSDYITNVIQRICGVEAEDTLEYSQQGYRVPFVIWSNYGLEHAYYEGISVNYLSGILMDAAQIPMTGYQQFLTELREVVPVVNANVFRDSEGTFYSWDELENSDYADLLNDYKILQYNHLVDGKNRADTFFGGLAQ